jgi:hypothetical protein
LIVAVVCLALSFVVMTSGISGAAEPARIGAVFSVTGRAAHGEGCEVGILEEVVIICCFKQFAVEVENR